MSDPSEQERPSEARIAIVMVLGVILLFLGACSLVVMVTWLATGQLDLKDPIGNVIVTFWGICFLIALAGTLMIRAARRWSRASNLSGDAA